MEKLSIFEFIQNLANIHLEKAYNQYINDIPKNNLHCYLIHQMKAKADILLLGEASGYAGCRYTGIPFTDGHVLSTSPFYTEMRKEGLMTIPIKNHIERTATMVYKFLGIHPTIFPRVVFWNAFPFHPFDTTPDSNRPPKPEELELGRNIVYDLFQIFNFKEYHGIGRCGFETLQWMKSNKDIPSFEPTFIKHPSYGGITQFKIDVCNVLHIKNEQKTLNFMVKK